MVFFATNHIYLNEVLIGDLITMVDYDTFKDRCILNLT